MKPLDPLTLPLTGRQLVEASAGTGKTYTIATLVLRLVVEHDLPLTRCLVVTFTRKAAAELRDRIRARLVEALAAAEAAVAGVAPADPIYAAVFGGVGAQRAAHRLALALADVDLAPITTIHAWCQRVLTEHAFERGGAFDVSLDQDDARWFDEAAQDLWTSALWEAPVALVEALEDADAYPDLRRVVALASSPTPPLPLDLPEVDLAPGWHAAAAPAFVALDAAASALRARLEAVRAAYRAVVLSGSLNKRSYDPANIDRDIDALGALAAAPFATAGSLRGYASKVRPDAWLAKVNKNQREPGVTPPFEAVDAFFEALAAAEEARGSARLRLLAAAWRAAPALVARLRGEGTAGFGELLGWLRDALAGPEGPALRDALRTAYGAVLVDEFQDTDPAQWAIFDALAGDTALPLLLIGDPKQAIYAFRGGDLDTYIAARATAAEAWTLGRNWRSDGALVEAVNAVFQSIDAPFADDRIDYPTVDAAHAAPRLHGAEGPVVPFGVRVLRGAPLKRGGFGAPKVGELVEDVADEVVATLEAGWEIRPKGGAARPVAPGDLAVLVDTHTHGRAVVAALQARRVPVVRWGADSVLQSEEAGHLALVLEALASPGSLAAVRAALATPLFGLDAHRLSALAEHDTAAAPWLDRFSKLREAWDRAGVARALLGLWRSEDVLRAVLARPGGERVLTNLRHLTELIHVAAQANGLGVAGVLAWFARARVEDDAEEHGEAEVRLESDARAVAVVTVHKAKGLQWPVVFVPFLASPKGRKDHVPVFHAAGEAVVDLAAAQASEGAADAELRQESVRLAYVALTRAEHRSVTWVCSAKGWGRSALAHLLVPEASPWEAKQAQASWIDDGVARWAALPGVGVAEAHGSALRGLGPWVAPGAVPATRGPRTLGRRFGADVRLSSFSALSRNPGDALGRDHDAVDLAAAGAAAPPATVRLAGFPRGTTAGTAVHAVMERLDFQDVASAGPLVAEQLAAHGLDALAWAPVLHEALGDVVAAPLAPDGHRLADVPRADRADELAFHLTAGGPGAPLQAAALAALFEAHVPAPLGPAYAARLAQLRFEPLDGLLTGFIDLVYRRPGPRGPVYTVVDHKTNHLGDTRDAYAPPHLEAAMVHHHYVLQAWIYLVALHRHLRARWPSYDPAVHLEGARYLFLRGLGPAPAGGVSAGVWTWSPPLALLEGLDALLGAPEVTP